ncbi:MAG TPA: CpsD/CapB family tyrosine-protein kinase [Erysipelothrix sp.]
MIFNKNKRKTMRKDTEVINKDTPFPYVESFNSLRTNLSFVTRANNAKTLLITSALPEEGKSTTAINLAITLAKDGNKVLLIDADLRKPSLQRYLRVRPGAIQGLTAVLTNQATTKEAIGYYEMLGIDLMMAGTRPPNPAELIALPKMKEMVKELEETYDYIIIDAPPAGVITDAAVLSRIADGVLLVVRQNFSTHQDVIKAKEQLTRVDAKIFGIILNNYNIERDTKDASAAQYYYYYGE